MDTKREISGSNHLDMNQYYTEDSQNKYGACGIRFSLNSERALSEIQIPICEVQKHLIKMLAEKTSCLMHTNGISGTVPI